MSFLNFIPEFITDAFVDSVKLLPSLFIIFVFIEIFETYFANKIDFLLSFSKKLGPILGAGLAIIPQCGFSVVMTTLFIKKFITLGTLLAVYIATSDEAIPILLAHPDQITTVGKIIVVKLVLAILTGYIVDCFIKTEVCTHNNKQQTNDIGCCEHEIGEHKFKNIIFHPIKHTINIFLFILAVCICLNFVFVNIGSDNFANLIMANSVLQPVILAMLGLIPNCAVSVLISMLYLKGVISFGSVIAGLSSNAGLGLLVLFSKKDSLKSFLLIVEILFVVSALSGVCIQIFKNCF